MNILDNKQGNEKSKSTKSTNFWLLFVTVWLSQVYNIWEHVDLE